MRIIQSKDGSTYMCHMNGQSFQSGNKEYVEEWRDKQMENEAEYKELLDIATQAYYNDKSFNYKGD
tara:strand:- start:265 stop:462 length:198 start_codon:yes stop_codon:yes gene_type:complete